MNISPVSIGMLPSTSHSQAAAIEPIIPAVTKFFVLNIVNVEYASRASPEPTASTTLFTKLGIVKASLKSLFFFLLFFCYNLHKKYL